MSRRQCSRLHKVDISRTWSFLRRPTKLLPNLRLTIRCLATSDTPTKHQLDMPWRWLISLIWKSRYYANKWLKLQMDWAMNSFNLLDWSLTEIRCNAFIQCNMNFFWINQTKQMNVNKHWSANLTFSCYYNIYSSSTHTHMHGESVNFHRCDRMTDQISFVLIAFKQMGTQNG